MPFWYFFTIPKMPKQVSHQSNLVEVQEYLLNEGQAVDIDTPVAMVENYWAKMRLKASGRGVPKDILQTRH